MLKVLWRETFKLWGYTLKKIPMIFWLKPKILELTDARSVVLIPFRRRSRNHLNSMYFGALCVGADLAPGLLTMRHLQKQDAKCTFLFKDFQAEFLKRCESNASFICEEGELIAAAITRAVQSKEREKATLNVTATATSDGVVEEVARFKMTISIKLKK